MKLIKTGVAPNSVVYEIKCGTCQSEYTYTLGDPEIKHMAGGQMETASKYLVCTVCGANMYVPRVPNLHR
jgi:rubredoxin